MIVSRFPYQKLTRKSVDGQRLYSCPDGSKLVSVTTVIDKTKPEEKKEALKKWATRVGVEKAAAITKSAGQRGTRIHTFLENHMNNDFIGEPGTNPFSIESHKMATHIIKNGLNNMTAFYGSEVNLYYPQLYAGTTDCVASYNGDLAICDFKQTNKPKKSEWVDEYRVQLAAYIIAHDNLYDTNIKYGIIMMCDPTLTYQQWVLEGTELEKYKKIWWEKLEQYYTKKFGV